MASICMCKSKKCPKKNECYRYMAEIDKQNQYYNNFEAIGCYEDFKWFYEIGNRKIREIENIKK